MTRLVIWLIAAMSLAVAGGRTPPIFLRFNDLRAAVSTVYDGPICWEQP